jgi:hypothetical protein
MLKIITLRKDKITDFAKERNDLLKKTNTDWGLFLDSDEEIYNLQFTIYNKFSSYKIKRDTYFLGKFIGSDYPTRLVKKGSGRWKRRVHEVWETNSKVGLLKNAVIIHNTANDLKNYIDKINYYSKLHALANKEEGKKSSLLKIIFFPIGKFIVTLVKSKNVVFSIMQSFHSFLAWTELYFLHS